MHGSEGKGSHHRAKQVVRHPKPGRLVNSLSGPQWQTEKPGIVLPAQGIALTLVVLALSSVSARCPEGAKAVCERNGCPGARECIGGVMLGCEVAEQCLHVPQPRLARDVVIIESVVPGQEIGMLFDGVDNRGVFNDRSFIFPASAGTSVRAGFVNITAPSNGNSLVTFARSRQPRLVPARWTPNADTIDVQLQNNIRFGVTFWVLAGNFATQQVNVATAVAAVNNAYVVEKVGLRIAYVSIHDETANPAVPPLLTFPGPSQQQFMNIGFTQGDINVYVIGTVNGANIAGVSFDGTPVILLGVDTLTFPQLLEHELGHAFVLWHVDNAPGFNFENVMWPSVSAHFLTEGQTFRMHFHPSSQINVLGLRQGLPTLVCMEPATPDCPANNRRLWADGSMPPN
jgi:hypothetical protein